MGKKLLTLLFASLFSFSSFSQYNNPANNVWAMSNYCGLDFNSAVLPIVTSAHPLVGNVSGEGCASIADGEGDLMFYTDGTTLWNDVGNIMPNGNDIDGAGDAKSMTQNSVIVPFPNNPQMYFLFILNQKSGVDIVNCRIVNMSLDNNHGDIDTANSFDELKVDSFLTEKIIAVSGCNNDFWLIVRPGGNPTTPTYHSFHITTSGINTNAVVSFVNAAPASWNFGIGVIKVNEQRTKILECGNKLMFYDFNPNTGVVSAGQQLDANANSYYGAAFSPDGTKIYASLGATYQFDLNSTNIPASKTQVGSSNGFIDLKLAPDGRIYLPANTPTNPGRYMARINFPNNAGTACGFQDSVPSLNFQGTSMLKGGAMPNEVWMPFTGGTINGHLVNDTTICNYSTAIVLHAAQGQANYQWDNGSTDTARSITQPGTYWVKYTDQFCNYQVDTYKVSSGLTPVLDIVRNGNILSTTGIYATYQWYRSGTLLAGATNQTLAISGNAVYSVKVSNAAGCSDSTSITISNATGIQNTGESAKGIYVYPNPAVSVLHIQSLQKVSAALYSVDGRCLKTPEPCTSLDISKLPKGIYLLKVWDMDGVLLKVEKVAKE